MQEALTFAAAVMTVDDASDSIVVSGEIVPAIVVLRRDCERRPVVDAVARLPRRCPP